MYTIRLDLRRLNKDKRRNIKRPDINRETIDGNIYQNNGDNAYIQQNQQYQQYGQQVISFGQPYNQAGYNSGQYNNVSYDGVTAYRATIEEPQETRADSDKRNKTKLKPKAKEEREAVNPKLIYRLALLIINVLLFIAIIAMLVLDISKQAELKAKEEEILHRPVYSAAHPTIDSSIREELERIALEEEEKKNQEYSAELTEATEGVSEDVISEYAVVVDVNTDTILAQRNYKERISPASMTKILTVLVAAENIPEEKLEDTFTITPEITYYSYKNDCSAAGFLDGETVTVRDLFYGTILPSGADAAVGLAEYVAGTQEDFVKLMNDKLETLGISETAHFTNCVGLYDEDHYCTVYDMAMIIHAAIDNEFVKEVMSTHVYTTSKTEQHPNGIEISNWFLRRIEDKDVGGEVVCAKTGFVNDAGNCAASYGSDGKGNDYIVVTGKSTSSWRCIYDHVALYRKYFPGYTGEAGDEDISETDEEEFDLSDNPEYSVNG